MLSPVESFSKLNELAQKENISFYALGKKLEIPTSFFSEWKRGKMMPKVDKLQKIANHFNVPITYFLDDTTHQQ